MTKKQAKNKANSIPDHQAKSSVDHLKPYQFKKGQSGNPAGRPAGKSLKEYAKEMLGAMDEEERQKFLHGIDKRVLWEMAEGTARTNVDLTTNGKDLPTPLLANVLPTNDGIKEGS